MKKEKEKQMNIVFSFSDDSSEKSEENKLSKSQLSKINILEAEIKELRNYLKVIDKTTHAILGEISRFQSRINDLSSKCKCCKHDKQKDGSCEKNNEVFEKGQKNKEMRSETDACAVSANYKLRENSNPCITNDY
ncbi:unnamed protein product [Lasius platythorax]|uniref:Uncharacterized protein n=1 Tax=Lasius platythorax TaxID=488582 RepID=A0AAV2NZX3_9HYME